MTVVREAGEAKRNTVSSPWRKASPPGDRDDLPGVADADDGDAVFLAERGIHQALAVEGAAGFDLAGHHFKAGEDLISEGGQIHAGHAELAGHVVVFVPDAVHEPFDGLARDEIVPEHAGRRFRWTFRNPRG